MKTKKPQYSFIRIVNPHIPVAVIIVGIIFLLILAGCATHNNQRAYKSDSRDCAVLMKKRYSHARSSRQPKIQQTKVHAEKINPAAKPLDKLAVAPAEKDMTYEPFQVSELAADKALRDQHSTPVHHTEQYPSKKIAGQPSYGNAEVGVSMDRPKPALALGEFNSFPDPFMYLSILIGAPALISLILLRAFTPTSMRISAWAAHHPLTTKGILGGLHVGSSLTGLLAGNYFAQQEIFFGDGLVASAAGGFLAASLLYPTGYKSLNRFSATYLRQKFHDVVLFSTGVALSLWAGNHLSPSNTFVQPGSNQSTVIDHVPKAQESIYDASTMLVGQQDPPVKKNGKITLTIVASVLFTLGILAVAGLSCSLSCSGAGTGAVLVAVLGGAGLILGFVAILKSIRKHRKVKRKKATVPVPS